MNDSSGRFRKFYLPPILYGFLILIVSSISVKVPDLNVGFQTDKLFHMLEYYIFAVLVMRAFTHSSKINLKNNRLVLTILFIGLFGMLDEAYQSLIPNRDSSIFDAVADSAGGILGSLFYLFIHSRSENRTHAPCGG
jgi:VanZ family protein